MLSSQCQQFSPPCHRRIPNKQLPWPTRHRGPGACHSLLCVRLLLRCALSVLLLLPSGQVACLSFLTLLTLYSTIIPISLYVSIEVRAGEQRIAPGKEASQAGVKTAEGTQEGEVLSVDAQG